MKVLLYFEDPEKIKTSGIGRAMEHQMTALKSAGVDFTINPKDDFDIAHINTLYPKSKRLLKKCHKKNIPVIVHGHSTHEDFRDSFRCWRFMGLFFNPMITYMYKHADYIITPTPYSKGLILNYHLCPNVYDISNGIDLKDYQYNEENKKAFQDYFHVKDGEKVVFGMGFPFYRKGIQDFIEVAKSFPNVKFIWPIHLSRILTEHRIVKAMKNKTPNVIMPKEYLPGKVIKGALHAADCFFFPSYEENEGIVVLEALACKTPLLVRDSPFLNPWLNDEEHCYKGKNNEDFIKKLNIILAGKDQTMLENGYKVAEERTLDKIGLKLKQAYEFCYNDFLNKQKQGKK